MTNKKPKFCIQFDDSNPTEEEKTKAICDLIFCLLKMAVKEESEKIKNRTKKEIQRKFYEFQARNLTGVKKEAKRKIKRHSNFVKPLLLLVFVLIRCFKRLPC